MKDSTCNELEFQLLTSSSYYKLIFYHLMINIFETGEMNRTIVIKQFGNQFTSSLKTNHTLGI